MRRGEIRDFGDVMDLGDVTESHLEETDARAAEDEVNGEGDVGHAHVSPPFDEDCW